MSTRVSVVYYGRFSDLKQSDTSIEDQFAQLDAHSSREGWTPIRKFEDRAIPGASVARRPQYQALLQAIRNRECNVVFAEALDRLSRDQEDTAALYKQCTFHNIRLITLQEGDITPLHVGLKGTMNALYLTDLAFKTRRGQAGRIEKGASAGGLSYGYNAGMSDGERGQRTINMAEAAIVIRIFERYAAGQAPRQIAHDLNAERIPGPRGRSWTQSTINGNRQRGTGILNNVLYEGRLVWNRLRYKKDPDTGRRRSELNKAEDVKTTLVPHLRIVTEELWSAVRSRQADLDSNATPAVDGQTFQSKQRPKYLLSGLVTCGACGGGMSVISATHIGCSAARNVGPTVCTYRRTVARKALESTVLDALRTRLMAPAVYEAFIRGFIAEWNREQGDRAGEQDRKRAELRLIERKIKNLSDAIENHGSSDALKGRLMEAEASKRKLVAELATAEAPAPRLLPNLANLYREKVAALQDALAGDDAQAARGQLRGLVEEVGVIPCPSNPKAPPTVEVRGALAAMLALGSGQSASAAEALGKQIKMVAGAGFEPAAFRL